MTTPFSDTVKTFLAEHPEQQRKIAASFEVAESTVERWGAGTAVPHPRIQRQVEAWIRVQRGWFEFSRG